MEHNNTPANAHKQDTSTPTSGDGLDVLEQLPAMRRYALSLTRDATDAEDLVHDALLRAYEKRDGFRGEPGTGERDRGERRLGPWLLSILHNIFVDRLRARRAERRRVEKIADEMRADPGAHHLPPQQDHALRLAQVREAFMALPEDQRAVLHLVTIEGLGYNEVAQTLGVPVGTVMSRLARARAALRAFEDSAAGNAPATARTLRPRPITRLRVVGGTDDPAE